MGISDANLPGGSGGQGTLSRLQDITEEKVWETVPPGGLQPKCHLASESATWWPG